MQLYTVEILNDDAIALLQGLERLKAIRLIPGIKKIPKKTASKIKLSQKYRGAISTELGEQMQTYIQQSRDEWQELTFYIPMQSLIL